MKREYVGMLFIVISVGLIFAADYFFGEQTNEYLTRFIVIWLLVGFYLGQYSMKFPKAF